MTKNCIQACKSWFPSSRVAMGTGNLCDWRKGCSSILCSKDTHIGDKRSSTSLQVLLKLRLQAAWGGSYGSKNGAGSGAGSIFLQATTAAAGTAVLHARSAQSMPWYSITTAAGGLSTCNSGAQLEPKYRIFQSLPAALHPQALCTVLYFIAAQSSPDAQQPFQQSVITFHFLHPMRAGSMAVVFKMQSCAWPANRGTNADLEYSGKTVLILMKHHV